MKENSGKRLNTVWFKLYDIPEESEPYEDSKKMSGWQGLRGGGAGGEGGRDD